jgi:hypothetical protein
MKSACTNNKLIDHNKAANISAIKKHSDVKNIKTKKLNIKDIQENPIIERRFKLTRELDKNMKLGLIAETSNKIILKASDLDDDNNNYKNDKAVFNSLMDPSIIVQNIYNNLSITSVKLDKNDKIRIIFRIINPREFGFTQVIKNMLKLDIIKAGAISKEDFIRKFQKIKFSNKDLNIISDLLKQISNSTYPYKEDTENSPSSLEAKQKMKELYSAQNDRNIVNLIKESAKAVGNKIRLNEYAKEAANKIKNKALSINKLKNLILNSKISAFIHKKMN